jgi:hypothetical protein
MVYNTENYWVLGFFHRQVFQFPKRRVFCFLEYGTMEKATKPSNSNLTSIQKISS